MTTVYVSIGNSDDKLSQVRWYDYCSGFRDTMLFWSGRGGTVKPIVYGVWHSEPVSQYQNMCMAVELAEENMDDLRKSLTVLRKTFDQNSVAFAVAETEFI